MFRFSPWRYALAAVVTFALNDCIALGVLYFRRMPDHSRVIDHLFKLPGATDPDPWLVAFHVAQAYIFIPWVLAFYAWLDRAPRTLLQQLDEAGVFTGEMGQAHSVLEDYRWYRFNKNVWFVLYLVGIIFALMMASYQWLHPPGWDDASQQYAQILVPANSFMLLLALWVILCLVGECITVLRKVFEQSKLRLRLRPFHPDHVCGLGPLKRYAEYLVSFSAGLGGYLLIDVLQDYSTGQLAKDAILRASLYAYVLLVPLFFVGSLWSSHLAMAKERSRMLLSIFPADSDEWRGASSMPAGDAASMKLHLDNLKVMQELRDIIMGFPVWPFDSGNVRHVLVVALGPTLPIVLDLLRSLLQRLHVL